MPKLTITEALAEIKTLVKRIDKKREFIRQYAARQEMLKDPLAKDGGSEKALREAFQAVHDLETNIVKLRVAISLANHTTDLTLAETTLPVSAWLAWRRDVAPTRQRFLSDALRGVEGLRKEAAQKGWQVVKDGQAAQPTDVVVNVDEKALQEEVEQMETMLGTLDGKLSLLNATTTVEY